MTSPVQNAEPSAQAARAAQTEREQTASYEPVAASSIVWPSNAPPNQGDRWIPLPKANPPSGGSIAPPAPPNMSMYNYFDYAYATPGGWVAGPGLPPWLWPQLFRTIPNRSPDEAALGSQMPHPVEAETPPRLQATAQAAPPNSEQAAAATFQHRVQRPARPQRPQPAPTARPGTSDPQTSPGQPNVPLQGGARTASGTAPSPQPGQRATPPEAVMPGQKPGGEQPEQNVVKPGQEQPGNVPTPPTVQVEPTQNLPAGGETGASGS